MRKRPGLRIKFLGIFCLLKVALTHFLHASDHLPSIDYETLLKKEKSKTLYEFDQEETERRKNLEEEKELIIFQHTPQGLILKNRLKMPLKLLRKLKKK